MWVTDMTIGSFEVRSPDRKCQGFTATCLPSPSSRGLCSSSASPSPLCSPFLADSTVNWALPSAPEQCCQCPQPQTR